MASISEDQRGKRRSVADAVSLIDVVKVNLHRTFGNLQSPSYLFI
jgi:hypothetical protein